MVHSRVDAIREIISDHQCTHILITDTIDVEYISGFRSSNATLLISKKKLDLFTDFRYKESAQNFCSVNKQWKFHLIQEGNYKFLVESLPSGSIVGIQSDVVTVDQFHELKRMLKGVKFVALSAELGTVSIQKTDAEIASMRKAARIGDRAFKEVLPFIKKGMTELELARTLERLCSSFGSEKPSFETIVLFGSRSALPHGRPGKRKLAVGDFILFDFGCTFDGFCSDMSRTIVYGKASEKQKDIYNLVLRAQSSARSIAKAGMKSGDLDHAARGIIEEEQLGEYFGHATGHGVGLRIHEKPRVSRKNESVLLENSVVTIEPGVYIPEAGGVRIEDMVVLHKNGATVLTQTPRKLIEIET